jgi:HSP20 family protein
MNFRLEDKTNHMTVTDPLRLFEDAVTRLMSEPRAGRPWSPAVDVYETPNELVFVADLPGVDSKDIDVRVENQTLTLAGERKFPPQEEGRGYHRIERSHGNFGRSFAVPNTFDTDKVSAAFKDGVLTVKLSKKEAAKPRQVRVEVKE